MADREWTADCVADHFEEAFRTLRKLPPVKAQGYFNTWPDIVRTSREIAAMEPQPMRVWPSDAAITRLEQTFDWVLWIEDAERKLVWSRAARVPWKQISGELGCDRTTAWRLRDAARSEAYSLFSKSRFANDFAIAYQQILANEKIVIPDLPSTAGLRFAGLA